MLAPAARLDTLPGGEFLRGQDDDEAFARALAHAPRLTLGWHAYRWAVRYLVQPNGPHAGQKYKPTRRQLLFWLHWYGLNPDGSWIYSSAARRLSKGAGKSPFAASTALIELCAPVRLKDFDPSQPGGCVGKPVAMPLVQIAAVSEAQTENTMRMVRAFARKGSEIAAAHHLDPGLKIYHKLDDGGKLEVVTNSAHSVEGAEATFVVADEAVSLATPIPTPAGWKLPGDLSVGDQVYGSSGAPVVVTYLTPIFRDRACSRVTFDDGTSIVVDDGHLWFAGPTSSQARMRVMTTREMRDRGCHFRIPKMRALGGSDVELPVDPYVLGAWLGDGSKRWASLTVGEQDADFTLAEVRRCGVPAATLVKSGADRALTVSLRGNRNGDLYTKDGSSVRGALVKLGVLNSKHIPSALKRASFRQRLALLQGLMDTNGHIQLNGSAVFVNGNRVLAEDVAELARTFGYAASVTSRAANRWPGCPVIYKVTFRPDTTAPAFRMPRKAALVRTPSERQSRYIRSIESVASEPVRCIEVDADDHLFVAGDGWTVTHNTEHWLGSAGEEFFNTLADNVAKSGSRMLETSNAWKPGIGSVAEATWNDFVSQEERIAAKGDTKSGSRILYDARIAPLDTDLKDLASLQRALDWVYDDCWWVNKSAYIPRIWRKSAKEDDSKRKYLNWPTVPEGAWIDTRDWILLAADGVDGRPKRELVDNERIVLFLDASKSRDATALVGCCLSDGHVFTIRVWEPKVRTAKVIDEDGDGTQADTAQIDFTEVDAVVSGAHEKFDVVAFWSDVREVEGFVKVTWPERWGAQYDRKYWAVRSGQVPEPIAWDMRSHSREFAFAAEQVQAEIEGRMFTHDGNPVTTRHVANCRKVDTRWGAVTVSKETPTSLDKIDAAVCVIGARLLYKIVTSNAQPEEPGEAYFYNRHGGW